MLLLSSDADTSDRRQLSMGIRLQVDPVNFHHSSLICVFLLDAVPEVCKWIDFQLNIRLHLEVINFLEFQNEIK